MLADKVAALDSTQLAELFDLRSPSFVLRGGSFEEDPYPAWNALRELGSVHEGTPGTLGGYFGPAVFSGIPFPERRHFTVFDYQTVNAVLQNDAIFSASPHPHDSDLYLNEAMLLFMDGGRHRKLRALVRNAFTPGRARWWVDNWIAETVDSLVDFIADRGRANLNVEVFGPIPVFTICSSFGMTTEEALELRAAIISESVGFETFHRLVSPLIAARREQPRDDLISLLIHEQVKDEDGTKHQLSDTDVLIFSFLLLAAGSGTTWKQLGITMVTLLERPELIARARTDPDLVGRVVTESVRWMPTDPSFARYAVDDTDLGGVAIPKGSVIHPLLASANRDPSRWDRPDEFDPDREVLPNAGFGRGPHVCLGQHVARAELCGAITTLLTRLPGLRLDIEAEPPRMVGLYERGMTSVPVVWDV